MKNHLLTLAVFLMIHFSCGAQIKDDLYYPNVINYHLMYTNAYFYDVNGKPVNFPGFSFTMYGGFKNKLNPSLGYMFYFPKEYSGQVLLTASNDTTQPQEKFLTSKLTGRGQVSIEVNVLFKFRGLSYVSKSEDFLILPMLGFRMIDHVITYDDSQLNYDRLTYYTVRNQGLSIGSLNTGFFSRCRIANFPVCFSVCHNFIIAREYEYSSSPEKSYSSYLNICMGLTFPIVKGPGVSKIKTIHY
jgi:hypothetical protein